MRKGKVGSSVSARAEADELHIRAVKEPPLDTVYALPKQGVVLLPGDIDSDVAAKVILGLYAACAEHAEVKLLISCDGGALFDGLAIADAIETLQLHSNTEIVGHVVGRAFSAAVFPLLACRRRLAAREAWIGVHGMSDIFQGDIRSAENEARFNQRLLEQQVAIFARRTKRDEAYWTPILKEQLMHHYSAVEALMEGLIDEVV